MIQDGTVTAIETSGLRDRLGKFLTQNPGVLKRPVVIRSHGGRARAIESGEVHIDVAFMGAPTADPRGNATGRMGKSHVVHLAMLKLTPTMQTQLLSSLITWLIMYTTMQFLKLM